MSQIAKKETIHAKGIDIGVYTYDFKNEYVSLTDIAKYRSIDARITIHNWLRSRDIVEFLALWEILHNPDFKRIEFDTFKKYSGSNAFVFSIKKWCEELHAVGLLTKSGRYAGGIYAHIDIALEFASWISPEFKLYIIKDYKRLKTDERSKLSLNWNLNREIAKLNYHIHTDAIKENLISEELTAAQMNYVYADEADMLNVVLFGMTAGEWRKQSGKETGNIRDFASIKQLLVLANLESYNALLIDEKIEQKERMLRLRRLATTQMAALDKLNIDSVKMLAGHSCKQNNN